MLTPSSTYFVYIHTCTMYVHVYNIMHVCVHVLFNCYKHTCTVLYDNSSLLVVASSCSDGTGSLQYDHQSGTGGGCGHSTWDHLVVHCSASSEDILLALLQPITHATQHCGSTGVCVCVCVCVCACCVVCVCVLYVLYVYMYILVYVYTSVFVCMII